ncbi:MAG: CPBP family intramembrane metalloprotease [Erysipelotrichales bacterium]|nr:CPBP family intramembrane metalloprotease [Erysipelotrichales bacterium]
MEPKNSVFHLDLIKHAICYLISYFGLYAFYIILTLIASSFSSFGTLNEVVQNSILTTLAYGLTFVSIIIYLYNIALKDILNQYKQIKNVLYGLLYGLGLLFGSVIVSAFCMQLGAILGIDVGINENESSIQEAIAAQPVLTALMTVVFAPVTEEIGYRFGIFGGIHKYSRIGAYLATSLIFALIHFDFSSSNMANELLNLPSYIFAGVWLCLTYEKSGSIVTSITAHMTNNAVALIASLAS